jgi:hypothetical protein
LTPGTIEGAEQLAKILTTYGEAKIVLESTGNLWIRIYDTLNQYGALRPYRTFGIWLSP